MQVITNGTIKMKGQERTSIKVNKQRLKAYFSGYLKVSLIELVYLDEVAGHFHVMLRQ